MKAINEFLITGITLSGFKCFEETTELPFGNPTVITGGNGRGKSSVADAIAFAITGQPFFGERGIDRLYSESNPELFVSLRFVDGDGDAHELTRTRVKDRMTVSYDGYDIRQRDLWDMFGEKDVFLSIFNPLYFIEELGDDGKKLLERYLPSISHEEVLAQLSDSVRAALENEKILSPEAYCKQRREDIREMEQTVIYLTGQKDLSAWQTRDRSAKLNELEACLDALTMERDRLESKRYEGLDIADIREKLFDLSARYSDMEKEGPEEDAEDDCGARLHELHRKLAERKAAVYAPKYIQPIADMKAKQKELYEHYIKETSACNSIQPGTVCPTCRRPVTDADLAAVQGALQQSTLAIVEEGKALKAQLEEVMELEKKSEETFLQFQADDVTALEAKIEQLTAEQAHTAEARRASDEQRKAEMKQIRQAIQEYTSDLECGALTQQEYERLMECQEELRQINTERQTLQNAVYKSPEEFDAEIAQLEVQIKGQKMLLNHVANYITHKTDMLFSKLRVNKVAFALYDVAKTTGEVRDAFKFTYDGRRYDRLSLSEKIRAGLEVSELVKRLTGRNYPVFLDNMESVDDLANVRPTGQIIMAKCVHGAELAVKAAGQPQMSKAA